MLRDSFEQMNCGSLWLLEKCGQRLTYAALILIAAEFYLLERQA